MQVRVSPYNAPFVPSNSSGVHWVGREFADMPHSGHVYAWVKEQGRLHVERLNAELIRSVALLPELDEMAGEGIKAAERMASSIRRQLSPNKSTVLPRNLPAKRRPVDVLRERAQ